MIRPIVRWPDPILRKVCEHVAVDERIRQLMADLVETLLASDGVGLAAPQIGEAVRVIAVKDGEAVHVIANPRWIKRNGIKVPSAETCLSEPERTTGKRTIVKVKRDTSVEISGIDREGNLTFLRAKGALAVRIQHEMDHCEGVCLWDLARSNRGEVIR